MITTWILVFHILTSQGHDALSAVSPFDTKDDCIRHAAHLFQNWSKMRDSEENHYHRLDSGIHYLEIHMGEYAASWSCVPSIPREWGLNNIPQ
jgi:hypothetical protein